MRADTLLAGGHEVRSLKPQVQFDLAALKTGPTFTVNSRLNGPQRRNPAPTPADQTEMIWNES
jgi:hypothetical protein